MEKLSYFAQCSVYVGIRLQVEERVKPWRTPHPCEEQMELKAMNDEIKIIPAHSKIPGWIAQSHSFYAKLLTGRSFFISISSRSTSNHYIWKISFTHEGIHSGERNFCICFISNSSIYFLSSSSWTKTPWNSFLNPIVCMRLKACLVCTSLMI